MPNPRAIILAAGRGSRMGELTSDRPKALLSLAGRNLLDWQLAALTDAGIEDVTVVGGYQVERLRASYANVIAYPRWEETNMVGTLCHVADLLEKSTTVVSYADVVYHPDHVRALLHAPEPISLTYDPAWHELWRLRFEDPLEDAESFAVSDGRVRRIGARPSTLREIEGQYMGLLKFSPSGWTVVARLLRTMPSDDIDRLDMTALLSRLLSGGVPVRGIPAEARWCEIDSASDAALYARRLNEGAWRHDWRWE